MADAICIYESFKNDFQIKHNSQHNIFQEDILIEMKHNLQYNISQVDFGFKKLCIIQYIFQEIFALKLSIIKTIFQEDFRIEIKHNSKHSRKIFRLKLSTIQKYLRKIFELKVSIIQNTFQEDFWTEIEHYSQHISRKSFRYFKKHCDLGSDSHFSFKYTEKCSENIQIVTNLWVASGINGFKEGQLKGIYSMHKQ